jgi:transposase-like protein
MHRNAPLTVEGRRRLCRRIEGDGFTIAQAAESMNISRQTASKWWNRYRVSGVTGLEDRPSRPRRSPMQTKARLERRVVALRQSRKIGPARLGPIVGLAPSTVHRVLVRHGCSRLSYTDRPTGRVIRRIATDHTGELVHLDVKKLAKIPKGGGWRTNGWKGRKLNGHGGRPRMGYSYIHSAIDAHSRLAYSEIHEDERAITNIAFFARAMAFFAAHGITIERVLTDNGSCYRSKDFEAQLVAATILHTFTRPYHPATNGKVERFNRTLLDEWGYVRAYGSESARRRAFDGWLHRYNHHRHHTAIGGPPISRVNNVLGYNT